MARVKAFRGLRPPVEIASSLASRPYDVMNSSEARVEAAGNEVSLLRVTKAEIDLNEGIDEHSKEVYDKVVENFNMFKNKGWLVKENEPKLYIYAQTMDGRTQYGIVGCTHIDDYFNNNIKKHELTRKDKEDDRMIHVNITNANVEPVFFAYPAHKEIDQIVSEVVNNEKAIYDFVAKEDGFGHKFWVINDQAKIKRIEEIFENEIPSLYVADGHHRTAAAARVGQERKANNPNHTGDEEYNYFMAVIFPDNQLKIIDYNRVVKDLNGLSEEEFISKLNKSFTIENMGTEIYTPSKLHEFSMYMSGNWYKMTAKEGTYNDADPIGVLDVTILSNLVLDEILDIKDLRTSKRIDFIGGIRGLGELKRRVDSGEMKAAFALYAVSMQQLIDIADSGNIMPPKTTWFEPKLRSGLVIHELE
ncbi:MAG: DUF1015 family protein [Bacteroidales bacterium]|jgi:uncharacterized protein (DUF1015 family)|nr:DUF1015 family protein [Bacteroidales bacterium]MDD2576574.1 DUF1015 family protein [Bacteroidales bacterium]MDD3286124.1 DUF1015 family protein [Bacteroidales bacterium]MDD3667287.1 DUF1015 family protein [Bacteroidales bacterium]MDD4067581.1 DUF1015 family protein [Bacteroidales bacterium]